MLHSRIPVPERRYAVYTIGNVEKLLVDQFLFGGWCIKQEVVQSIISRAREDADEFGILMSGRMPIVFNKDVGLMTALTHAMGSDLTHMNIASAALAKREAAQR